MSDNVMDLEMQQWMLLGVTAVVGALVTVVTILWGRMTKCQDDHADCRVKTAELSVQNTHQAAQIASLQTMADEAIKNATEAKRKADVVERRVENISGSGIRPDPN